MRIIKKFFKKPRCGWIEVKPELEEDIWYLYNIIKSGNGIKMKIDRKVKVQRGEYAVKKIQRKQILLMLKTLSIEF